MNALWFIAKRIRSAENGSFSSLVVKIAIVSIAIGLAAMIISFAILEGFRSNIHDKIFSFGGHIQLTKYDLNNYHEELPVGSSSIKDFNKIKEIEHIQSYAIKTALLKTDDEVQGVLFKGISKDFNYKAFRNNILEGEMPAYKDSLGETEIMMSKKMADKLMLKLNDKVVIFFMQNPPRARKLKIKAIYQTGMEEFDELYLLGDLQLLRNINHWSDTLAGGYEIFVKDFNKLEQSGKAIFDTMGYDLQLEKITDKYVQIFDWLILLDNNVIIFLSLILAVACFNMVSTIIILIMERTNMIGTLKALGATPRQINNIFHLVGINMIVKGMIFGNIFGLGFCALQYYFHLIPLDPSNYYIAYVPIEWHWGFFLLVNVAIFILVGLVINLPLLIIKRLKPIQSIKFS